MPQMTSNILFFLPEEFLLHVWCPAHSENQELWAGAASQLFLFLKGKWGQRQEEARIVVTTGEVEFEEQDFLIEVRRKDD